MNERPTSITAIGWIVIVAGVLSLFVNLLVMTSLPAEEQAGGSALSVQVQYTIGLAGFVVMIVSGAAMLSGKNWSRFLYVAWSVTSYFILFFTSPEKGVLVPGFLVFLLITFFLFRREANQYFVPVEAAG